MFSREVRYHGTWTTAAVSNTVATMPRLKAARMEIRTGTSVESLVRPLLRRLGLALDRLGGEGRDEIGSVPPLRKRAALGQRLHLARPDLAQQDDALVRLAEPLMLAVGNHALPEQRHRVLDHEQERIVLVDIVEPDLAIDDARDRLLPRFVPCAL